MHSLPRDVPAISGVSGSSLMRAHEQRNLEVQLVVFDAKVSIVSTHLEMELK